jgi:hypothetical protein
MGQRGSDVLGDPVREIFLLGVAAHVAERQHREGGVVGECERHFGRILRSGTARLDTINPHRPRDVLDVVLAEIGKSDRQPFADLLAHRGADADFSRGCERFDPRRHVDPVAEHVAFVGDNIAEIDADAIANALAFRPAGIAILHPLLHQDRAAHGIDDRGELDQHAVAGGFEEASAMLVNQWVDQFTAMALQTRERPFLVHAHQPRISDDVGAKDRRQPPLDAFFRHDALPSAV